MYTCMLCDIYIRYTNLTSRTSCVEGPSVTKGLHLNTAQRLQPVASKLIRSSPAWEEIPLCWYTNCCYDWAAFFDTTLTNIAISNCAFIWKRWNTEWGETTLNWWNHGNYSFRGGSRGFLFIDQLTWTVNQSEFSCQWAANDSTCSISWKVADKCCFLALKMPRCQTG